MTHLPSKGEVIAIMAFSIGFTEPVEYKRGGINYAFAVKV